MTATLALRLAAARGSDAAAAAAGGRSLLLLRTPPTASSRRTSTIGPLHCRRSPVVVAAAAALPGASVISTSSCAHHRNQSRYQHQRRRRRRQQQFGSSCSQAALDCKLFGPQHRDSRMPWPQLSRITFRRPHSTLPSSHHHDSESDDDGESGEGAHNSHHRHRHHPCRPRLISLRNVGIFAHVDAGKTTVTERMLALSGTVGAPGSVDDGDTVTDYLPAERERGITIQSAAVGFDWVVPPARKGEAPARVNVNLIDTPGHVDFSVEVHRSVAVLDGAVLVVDAVAGVQAQTETVWRAIRNNNADIGSGGGNKSAHGSHAHEPLPALMFINKMDREGSDFRQAMDTVRRKLGGSNPIPVQLPLYRAEDHGNESGARGRLATTVNGLGPNIVAGSLDEPPPHGEFVGLVDLVHMRAMLYPDNAENLSVEDAAPTVVSLLHPNVKENNPSLFEAASDARRDLISSLADVDGIMEDLYLNAMERDDGEGDGDGDEDGWDCPILDGVSTRDVRSSLRRATLARTVMPTLCGAALRGVGVEPVLDCVAEYLPCPLDRLPPQLCLLGNAQNKTQKGQAPNGDETNPDDAITLGHPLNPSTLAYVFKVLHMKGRGGSGDGRVAFARVYSGTLRARDSVRVITPTIGDTGDDDNGKKARKHPVERIGGMLELSGGRFDNMPEGSCSSGDVCALVGLKSVVTGDTLLLTSSASSDEKKKSGKNKKKKKECNNWKQYMDGVHLAGLTSPRPVLTIRVEAASSSEQARLSAALALLTVEDPSLVLEETPNTTLISGLGELHIEIVLDRLRREHGLEVRTGKPAVKYRETVLLEDGEEIETDGMVEYDRAVGGVRLHGAVRLRLRQRARPDSGRLSGHQLCVPPEDPVVKLSPETRMYFNLDPNAASDESEHKYPPALNALLSGARGSLKRGRLGPYPLANLECHILEVDSELSSPDSLPGAMRAAAANAVSTLLESLAKEGRMLILEPKMNVEISVPTSKVGDVLSDLTGRRGAVDDVAMAEEGSSGASDHVKSMVRAEVPLVEILGYANSLRSLTGGEGAFSAEYKGHAPQDGI